MTAGPGSSTRWALARRLTGRHPGNRGSNRRRARHIDSNWIDQQAHLSREDGMDALDQTRGGPNGLGMIRESRLLSSPLLRTQLAKTRAMTITWITSTDPRKQRCLT